MEIKVKIMSIDQETPDTRRVIIHKPVGLRVTPGKAFILSIAKPGFEGIKKPFHTTSLNTDYYLEFMMKDALKHDKFTEGLRELRASDELILSDMVGSLEYKGKGMFIAFGSAVAPFIGMLRQLRQDDQLSGHSLVYVSKTKEDILLERELKHMLERNCHLVLTRENLPGYETRKLDETFFKDKVHNLNQTFYIAGPESFVKEISQILTQMGVSSIVSEIIE